MPLGVFHYCFRSKEELLVYAIETLNEHNRQAAISTIGRHRTVRAAFRAAFRAYLGEVERNPGWHQVTYELTQYTLRQPKFADVARRQYELYLEVNSDLLDTVADKLGIEWTIQRPTLARYLLNMVEGITLQWLVDRDSDAALAVFDQLAEHCDTLSRPQPTQKPA